MNQNDMPVFCDVSAEEQVTILIKKISNSLSWYKAKLSSYLLDIYYFIFQEYKANKMTLNYD